MFNSVWFESTSEKNSRVNKISFWFNYIYLKLKELNLSKIPKDASEIPLDQKNELPFANQHSSNNMHE